MTDTIQDLYAAHNDAVDLMEKAAWQRHFETRTVCDNENRMISNNSDASSNCNLIYTVQLCCRFCIDRVLLLESRVRRSGRFGSGEDGAEATANAELVHNSHWSHCTATEDFLIRWDAWTLALSVALVLQCETSFACVVSLQPAVDPVA